MPFIALAFKNILRRPIRSLLTALGVALAVATFLCLVGVSNDFVGSIRGRYANQGIDLVVLKSGRTDQVYATVPEKLGDDIKALPNMEYVSPILFDVVTFDDSDLVGVFIEAWYADSPLFNRMKMLTGRRLVAGDRGTVMLGKLLAENLQKKVGDKLVVDSRPLTVVGTYESENAFENGGALMLLPELQEIMDRQGQVTGFEIILKDDSEAATAESRKQIEDLRNAEGRPLHLAPMPVDQQTASFIFVRIAKAVAWFTSLIAIIIGCVGVLNTMIMSVYERTHEIGILRAMGWRESRVVRMIMLEALGVSLFGALIGTLCAIVLMRMIAMRPEVRATIHGYVSPDIIAQGIVVACIVGVLGSIYPAYRAAKQLPVEALRHE